MRLIGNYKNKKRSYWHYMITTFDANGNIDNCSILENRPTHQYPINIKNGSSLLERLKTEESNKIILNADMNDSFNLGQDYKSSLYVGGDDNPIPDNVEFSLVKNPIFETEVCFEKCKRKSDIKMEAFYRDITPRIHEKNLCALLMKHIFNDSIRRDGNTIRIIDRFYYSAAYNLMSVD